MASNDDDLFMDELEGDFLNDDNDSPSGSDSDDGQASDDWLEETDVPGQLAVDVYQTKEDIVVVAPVPGVNKADLDLSIVESTLTIRGTRKGNDKANDKIRTSDYFVQECYWGEFSRSIILPVQVKDEEADAKLEDGMLTVRVPKAQQEKIKKISIS